MSNHVSPMNVTLNKYESNCTIRIKRSTTAGTRLGIPPWREAQFQGALFCRAFEDEWYVRRQSRREDGDGAAYREQMTEMVREGGHQRFGDTFRQGSQTDNGLLGRGGCPSGDRTGQAGREQGAGNLAAGQRQGCYRVDLQAFFSALAQDISV